MNTPKFIYPEEIKQIKRRYEKRGKLSLMGKNHSDELYTPKEAVEILMPYLKQGWIIRDCAWGTGKNDLIVDSVKEVSK